MAKHGSKLRRALDQFQGKDYSKIKQKQQQKEAEKKRQSKAELDDLEDDDDDEEWQSAEEDADDGSEDEEMPAGFDITQLDESDSDSDGADEDEDEDEEMTTSSRLNGGVSLSQGDGEEEDEDEDEEEDIPLSDIEGDDEDIVPHQRLTINNTSALERALAAIALPMTSMPFSEHMSITSADKISIPDVEDDLNRELAFYAQSLAAVKEGRSRLRKEGVPFTRPTDYFAEMVKSDEHMGKIKGKLVADAAAKKASQDARKQRELKKFGKQVQQEKLKERAKAKRDMLDKVNLLKRKRQDGGGLNTANEEDMFDIALEDAAETARKDKVAKRAHGSQSRQRGGPAGGPAGGPSNAKRQKKDQKFGFGGKKKFTKSNDAGSSADMRGYSVKKMKTPAKRPGKARRQQARQ